MLSLLSYATEYNKKKMKKFRNSKIFHFYNQDKNQARHFEQEVFFQRFLIGLFKSKKKNQGDVFWEFDFENSSQI